MNVTLDELTGRELYVVNEIMEACGDPQASWQIYGVLEVDQEPQPDEYQQRIWRVCADPRHRSSVTFADEQVVGIERGQDGTQTVTISTP